MEYRYFVHGILNEDEDITIMVYGSTPMDAMNKAVDLVKEYNEDDIFDIKDVELIEDLPNTNYGVDGY